MKYLLIPVLLLAILSGCRTPKERAERLVKRANKIYPIDSLVSERIQIDTLIQYDTTVVVDSIRVTTTIPVYKDTVIKGAIVKKPIKYNKSVIFDNEKARVTATTSSSGGIDLDILFKEQKIKVSGTVNYKKQIITHRKLITVHVKVRGWIWWCGLVAIGLVGATAIILSIRMIKKLNILSA